MIVTAATAGAVGILAGVMSSQGGIEDKPHPKEKSLIKATLDSADYLKTMAGKPLGIAGINLSVGSLLKQSQLFTGILGSFFQVAGALIDSFLMPFMPFLFDQVAKMAGFVPNANKFGQIVYDKVESISGSLMDVWRMLLNIPWGDVWGALKEFLTDMSYNITALPAVMGRAFLDNLALGIPGVKEGRILMEELNSGGLWNTMKSLVTFFAGKTFSEIVTDLAKELVKGMMPPSFKTGGMDKLAILLEQMENNATTLASTAAFNVAHAGKSEAQKAEIAFGGEGAMAPLTPQEQEEMEKMAFKQATQKQQLSMSQGVLMFGDEGY